MLGNSPHGRSNESDGARSLARSLAHGGMWNCRSSEIRQREVRATNEPESKQSWRRSQRNLLRKRPKTKCWNQIESRRFVMTMMAVAAADEMTFVRPDSSALMAVLCGHVFPETRKRSLDRRRRRRKGFSQNSVINSVAATTAAACNAGAADDSLPLLFWRCHLKWHFVTQRRIPSPPLARSPLSPLFQLQGAPLGAGGAAAIDRFGANQSWPRFLSVVSAQHAIHMLLSLRRSRARSSLTRPFPPDNIQRGGAHFTFRCTSLVLRPRSSCTNVE